MKKHYKNIGRHLAAAALLLLPGLAEAQAPAYDYLNGNNINARFNADGQLFWDGKHGNFVAPKSGTANSISAAALWIGGMDSKGDLHVAAQTYRETGSDFWPGPLDTAKGNADAASSSAYNHVWKITRLEIDSFRAGLSTPAAITGWPGNGNTAKGFSHVMAPFVDVNGNGIYEPSKGDYPDMKGDVMLWWVFNDKLNQHTETGGDALGVEVQASAYAFNCQDPVLNNTIFVHFKMINRSGTDYDSTYAGLWTDLDIGNIFNDYIGSDSALNTYYGYNGTNDDRDTTVTAKQGTYTFTGYGKKLPAQAVTFLQGVNDDNGKEMRMSHFIYYNNDATYKGNPKGYSEYYKFLRGEWYNGKETYGGDGFGGTTPTNYAFPGDPSDPAQWSEISANNTPGDRRGLGSFGPFTFKAGEAREFTAAFSFHDASGGKSLNSIRDMKKDLAMLTEAYHKGISPCSGISTCTAGNNCVHPGDADNNGVANGSDPFYIAYAFGANGPARPFASAAWVPQNAQDWNQQFPDGKDFKYADCNGDGRIDSTDVMPVLINFDRTHSKDIIDNRAGNPVLRINADNDTFMTSHILGGSVTLGDEVTPADNVLGVTLGMHFDPAVFDISTFTPDVTSSVIGLPSDVILLVHTDTATGNVVITVVNNKKKDKPIKGGVVVRWRIVIEDNVGGYNPTDISVINQAVVNQNLQQIPVNIQDAKVYIKKSGILSYTDFSSLVNLFPNPAQNELNIALQKGGEGTVRIYNLEGQLMKAAGNTLENTMKINIADLPHGFYFVEVNTPTGRAVKKFSK